MGKHVADRATRRDWARGERAELGQYNGNGRAVRLGAVLDRKAGARVRLELANGKGAV
jgi:hypothetical protein